MRKPKQLSWKPIRRGNLYCAPACGAGCTVLEWERATKRGESLALRLGKGWRPEIFENLGWHLRVVSKCGRIKVSIGILPDGSVSHYTAYLGEPGPGGRWTVSAKTPERAVLRVIAIGKKNVAELVALVDDL